MPSAPIIKSCWIPRAIQDQLVALAQEWEPLEVGGVLAGYWADDCAVITDFVGPGQDAEHHRYTFLPDHAFHAQEIERLYHASQGTTVYLGDWHTHPNGLPRLSPLDKRTLRTIATTPEARCTRPLMLLLSGHRSTWDLNVFTLGPQRKFLPPPVVAADLRIF